MTAQAICGIAAAWAAFRAPVGLRLTRPVVLAFGAAVLDAASMAKQGKAVAEIRRHVDRTCGGRG